MKLTKKDYKYLALWSAEALADAEVRHYTELRDAALLRGNLLRKKMKAFVKKRKK